jgi:S1-C subfamily serine protease
VPNVEALHDLLSGEQIGSRLRLLVLRGGVRQELSVEVDERREHRC